MLIVSGCRPLCFRKHALYDTVKFMEYFFVHSLWVYIWEEWKLFFAVGLGTYILLHHPHFCCSNYLLHLRFLCLLSLSVNYNVILKAVTVCECFFFLIILLCHLSGSIWLHAHIRIGVFFIILNFHLCICGFILCLVLIFEVYFSNISRSHFSFFMCDVHMEYFFLLDFHYLWIFVENASLYICILVWF